MARKGEAADPATLRRSFSEDVAPMAESASVDITFPDSEEVRWPVSDMAPLRCMRLRCRNKRGDASARVWPYGAREVAQLSFIYLFFFSPRCSRAFRSRAWS